MGPACGQGFLAWVGSTHHFMGWVRPMPSPMVHTCFCRVGKWNCGRKEGFSWKHGHKSFIFSRCFGSWPECYCCKGGSRSHCLEWGQYHHTYWETISKKKCSRALKNALMQFLQRTILRCLLPTKIKSIIDFKEVRHAQFWLWTTERFRVQGSLWPTAPQDEGGRPSWAIGAQILYWQTTRQVGHEIRGWPKICGTWRLVRPWCVSIAGRTFEPTLVHTWIMDVPYIGQ